MSDVTVVLDDQPIIIGKRDAPVEVTVEEVAVQVTVTGPAGPPGTALGATVIVSTTAPADLDAVWVDIS